MDRKEAFDIKKQYGEEAYYLALDILDKEHAISFWNDKKNSAEFFIKQNQEKIKKFQVKLEKAKGAKN